MRDNRPSCGSFPEHAVIEENATPEEVDYLSQLSNQVEKILEQSIPEITEEEFALDDYQSPECSPIFWITKWVDYSDKHGIGYRLCDDSVGVHFNDNSCMILDQAGNNLTCIEKNNEERYFSIQDGEVPVSLNKNFTLLKYFKSYMSDNLVNAEEGLDQRDGDVLARLPTLRVWFRTKSAIVLYLSNGTLQINFFNDSVKMVMCPLMRAVTFSDQNKLSNLRRNGCPEKIVHRLKYAKTMIAQLMTLSASGSTVPQA